MSDAQQEQLKLKKSVTMIKASIVSHLAKSAIMDIDGDESNSLLTISALNREIEGVLRGMLRDSGMQVTGEDPEYPKQVAVMTHSLTVERATKFDGMLQQYAHQQKAAAPAR